MTNPSGFSSDAPSTAKASWYTRRWVHVIAALLLGLGIGAAGGSSSASDADKKAAAAELRAVTAEAEASRASAESQVAQELAAVAQSEAEASVKAERDALAAQKAALDARERRISGAEAAAKASEFEGEGIYLVGSDIRPGTYKSAGGDGCYWARHNKANDILDNHIGNGPTVVTVRSSDFSLEVNNCATFRKV